MKIKSTKISTAKFNLFGSKKPMTETVIENIPEKSKFEKLSSGVKTSMKNFANSETTKEVGRSALNGAAGGLGYIAGYYIGNYIVEKAEQVREVVKVWAEEKAQTDVQGAPQNNDSEFITKSEFEALKNELIDILADQSQEIEIKLNNRLDKISDNIGSLSTEIASLVKQAQAKQKV